MLFCSCVFGPFWRCGYLALGGGGGGGGGAGLGAFRAFVRFALIWVCLFPLRVWDRLLLVIVALSGLFSSLF